MTGPRNKFIRKKWSIKFKVWAHAFFTNHLPFKIYLILSLVLRPVTKCMLFCV